VTGGSAAHLTLFGTPRIVCDGTEVALPVRKTLALVVYLAVEGRSSRVRLAELFWGDLDDARARRNLRHALHRLRTTAIGPAVVADDEQVGVVGIGNDLEAFERAVASDRLADAHGLRSGAFCEGLDLADAPGFDEWLRDRRDRFLRAWRTAMARHAGQLEGRGQLRPALAIHRQLLDDDPLQEAGYRDLMRLHDALGERADALDAFARCEKTLRDELGLEPLPETRLLADRIGSRLPEGASGSVSDADADPQRRAPAVDLRRVPMVARARELAALAAFETSVVLIEGDAGVGKSRLAQELAAQPSASAMPTGGDDHETLTVRFTDMSSSTPFYAVADALRSPATQRRIAGLAPVWRREVARLLPELTEPGTLPEEPAPTPTEARSRLLEALAQALAIAAGPVRWIVFDDLHWADASSVELLAHLARRRRQVPLAMSRVLVTARSVELADNPAACAALQAIGGEGDLSRLALEAFDDWSMLQLVQRLSGSAGGVRFAARLVSATAGNVFFALETIRALFESGELRFDAARGWSTRYDESTTDYAELPLPVSVVEAVRSRITRLGAATQRVLETVALAEDGSTLAEIQGGTALTEWETLEGLERGVAAHVVERSAEGYRFAHDLFRVALRSGMSAERQRLIHAKLAAALEPLDVAPSRVAAHWQQAGRNEAAIKAWIRAAESATTLHAHREAIEHYRRAEALETDDGRAFELIDVQLVTMNAAAITDRSAELLQRMHDIAVRTASSPRRFQALVREAEAVALVRNMPAAEGLVLRALREFEPPGGRYHLHALSIAAFAAGFLDRPEEALDRYLVALDVANRSVPLARATMGAAAAMAAARLNRLEEASELRDRAMLAAAETPAPLARTQVLSNGSFVARALGDRAGALHALREAVELATKVRLTSYLHAYAANLCETLADDGQRDAADARRQTLDDATTDDMAVFRYMARISAAPVHALLGRIGAAIDATRDATKLADAVGQLSNRREARLLCAGYLMRIGARGEALALVEEAKALVIPGWSRPLLAVENLRACVELDRDPAAARDRLIAATRKPFVDRVLQPHLEEAHCLLGRCELALGRPDGARTAVAGVRFSTALESDAMTVRLTANATDGRLDAAAMQAAVELLDSDRVPPLQALDLMRVVASLRSDGSRRKGRDRGWQRRLEDTAQAIADSLEASLPLQAAFIRMHRDLLT
jgi:DNA-binding SARP family transcriptional activator